MLPHFLEPCGPESKNTPISAIHRLRRAGPFHGSTGHVFHWPASSEAPKTILYLIPGNPGQADYFHQFLGQLHDSHPDLSIFAKSHIGHTPWVCPPSSKDELGLPCQVESAVAMVDDLREAFPSARVVLAGHSIGAWIAMQVTKARPESVHKALLLFPTLSNISGTPNGRRMAWVTWPIAAVIAGLLSPILGILPLFIFRLLFPVWPDEQIGVLRSMLSYPEAVVAALRMASDEFATLKALDAGLIQANEKRIFLYYAAHDDWVGSERGQVISVLAGSEHVLDDPEDTPHAFCITLRHSHRVAAQCSRWLQEGQLAD